MTAHAHAPAGLAATTMARPRTIAEACALLADAQASGKRAMMLAGGTDVIVDRHLLPVQKAEKVDLCVDMTAIAELARIDAKDEGGEARLVFGGGVSYWQLRTDPRVTKAVPMLAAMAKDVGAVQIQTRGTLGGNIATASPAADGVPALMALDGVVTLAKKGGERKVRLEDFFTGYRKTVMGPDELIRSIDVRVPKHGARVVWRKVGTRLAQAISKVALASVVELDGGDGTSASSRRGPHQVVSRARFGMASVAAVTHPLRNVRALVEGKRLADLDRGAVDAAVDKDITPIDDVRSTGEYRLHVAKALVWRALVG
jgi:CO/xanthine dehydrogenase FAD-binding subunit